MVRLRVLVKLYKKMKVNVGIVHIVCVCACAPTCVHVLSLTCEVGVDAGSNGDLLTS